MAAIGSQYVATGATAAFTTATTIFGTLDILSIGWDGAFSYEPIETTNLATATARTYKPSNLYDGGTITLECHLDADFNGSTYWTPITPTLAADTLTITLPSSTTTSTWAAAVVITGISFSAPLEELITATITCKVSGVITITT